MWNSCWARIIYELQTPGQAHLFAKIMHHLERSWVARRIAIINLYIRSLRFHSDFESLVGYYDWLIDWPHHACAQGSASLASHSPTHHLQNCNLCSKLTPWSWPDISQSIMHPHFGNRGASPPPFRGTGTPHHTSNKDTSLRAKKLPRLRTGCVELPARRHCKSRTVIGKFQDWIENSSISSGICLTALTAPKWLG